MGQVIIEGDVYRALFQNGWLKFRKVNSKSRFEAITLEDAYNLAREQRCFAFVR